MRQVCGFIASTCFGHQYAHHQADNVEAIKLHTLTHLVGSLPFTKSTMHGHMNIEFTRCSLIKQAQVCSCKKHM
jgi:hypothetical protein